METGIEKAVRLAGSQTALANMLGVTPQAVQKWTAQDKPPLNRCKQIEDVLGGQVTRAELDPDAFSERPQVSSPTDEERRQADRRSQEDRRAQEERRAAERRAQEQGAM